MESDRVRIRTEEQLLISQRFEHFLEWVDQEIKSMRIEFADLIKEREKKAWNDHVTSLIPWFGIEIPITRSSLRLERRVRNENGLSGF